MMRNPRSGPDAPARPLASSTACSLLVPPAWPPMPSPSVPGWRVSTEPAPGPHCRPRRAVQARTGRWPIRDGGRRPGRDQPRPGLTRRLGRGQLGAGAALPPDRERHRHDQGDPVEHIVEPLGAGDQLDPVDPGGQHEDRQHGAPHVEPARPQLCRAEEHGREGRQQQRGAEGQRGPAQRREQDAGRRRDMPEKIRDRHVQPPTRTPDSRAASPLPPVAYMYRPAGVRSRNHQLIRATMIT